MSEAPERIWAYGGKCTDFSVRGWDDRSVEPAVEYVRADLVEAIYDACVEVGNADKERIQALEQERDEARSGSIPDHVWEALAEHVEFNPAMHLDTWNLLNRIMEYKPEASLGEKEDGQ